MPAFTRKKLSGSTNGRPQNLSTSASTTLLHTAINVTNKFDELFLWCTNYSASAADLTLEVGGTANGDQIIITIPAKSRVAIPGIMLQSGVIVYGKSQTANALAVNGYVNEIDQTN